MPLVPGPAVTFPINRPCDLRTLHPLVRDLACSILAQQETIEALDQRDTSLQNQIDTIETQINNISISSASCHDGIVDGIGALSNTYQTVQLAVAGGARSICVTADVTETVPASAGGDNVCIELFRNSVVTVTVDSYLTNGNYNIRGCTENTVATSTGPSLEFAIAGLSNTFATATASVSLQNLRVFSSVGNTRLILNAGASAVGTVIDTCTFLGTGGAPLSWEIAVTSPVMFVNNTVGAPIPSAFFFSGYDTAIPVVISNNNMQNITVTGANITNLSVSKNVINTLTLSNPVTATTISDNTMSTLSTTDLIDSTITGNTTTDTAAGFSFGQVTDSTITGNRTGTMTFVGDVTRGTITANTLDSLGSTDLDFQSGLTSSTISENILRQGDISAAGGASAVTISGNVVEGGSISISGGNVSFSSIIGNRIQASLDTGILIAAACNRSTIADNTIENDDNGARITIGQASAQTTISGNTLEADAGAATSDASIILTGNMNNFTVTGNVLFGISTAVADNTDIRFVDDILNCTITGNNIRREGGGTPATSGRIVGGSFFSSTFANNRVNGDIRETDTPGFGSSFTGNVCNSIFLLDGAANNSFTGNHTTSVTIGEGINCTASVGSNVLVGNRLEATGAQTAAFGVGGGAADIIANNRTSV